MSCRLRNKFELKSLGMGFARAFKEDAAMMNKWRTRRDNPNVNFAQSSFQTNPLAVLIQNMRVENIVPGARLSCRPTCINLNWSVDEKTVPPRDSHAQKKKELCGPKTSLHEVYGRDWKYPGLVEYPQWCSLILERISNNFKLGKKEHPQTYTV